MRSYDSIASSHTDPTVFSWEAPALSSDRARIDDGISSDPIDSSNLLFNVLFSLLSNPLEDLREEFLAALFFGIVEELFRRGLFHQDPIGHQDDAIGHFPRKAHFMGDADHGHPFSG